MRRKWGDQIFEGERESEREKERNGDFKAMEKNYHFEERGRAGDRREMRRQGGGDILRIKRERERKVR